jgi:hypothetical protein
MLATTFQLTVLTITTVRQVNAFVILTSPGVRPRELVLEFLLAALLITIAALV